MKELIIPKSTQDFLLTLTKKHHTEKLVQLKFMVHPANVTTIQRYVETLENSDAVPWREVAAKRGSIPSSVLRGARSKKRSPRHGLPSLPGFLSGISARWSRGKTHRQRDRQKAGSSAAYRLSGVSLGGHQSDGIISRYKKNDIW